MSGRDSKSLVRLTTAPNPALAHVWEQALREEGIKCKVVGDYLDAGIGNIPGVRAEIWVDQADLPKAQETLRHHRSLASSSSPDEEAEEMESGEDEFLESP